MNDVSASTAPETVSQTVWPLTEAQAGLWYAQQLAPNNPSFNTAHALWIDGPLNVPDFTDAANQAAKEAQSLSLGMRQGPHGPEQWLDPARTPWLEIIDLRHMPDARAAAQAAMQQDVTTPLSPERDALARQQLYILAADRHVWYQRAHHLTNDGYGMALWTTRVCEYYANEIPPTMQVALDPLNVVIHEDQAYRHSEQRQKDATFWREAFTPAPEVAGMAAGRAVSTRHAHRQTTSLPPDKRVRLLAYAAQLDLAWPDVFTALTALYCLRMAGAGQTVVGVPYMNRLGRATARATATVMNVLPLLVTANADTPLQEFIKALSITQLRARRHGRFRSEQLRRDLGLLGGQRRLHGALINVQPFYKPVVLPGVSTELEVLGTGPVDDITIGLRGDGVQMLDLEIEANPDLYSLDAVNAHLTRLAEFLDAAPDAHTVGDMPLCGPAEAQRCLFDFNNTRHPVPDTTLTALITASMARNPHAVALAFEGTQLSYAELDQRTQALATLLLQQGVQADDLVAVALPRSLDLLIALVAVLRAGGAYLPLDLNHPAERLSQVVRLARPCCALISAADIPKLPATLTCLPPPTWPTQADATPLPDVLPTQAAYVIYTSGSTGEPKGVVVEHRAIVNRLAWMRQHYGFTPNERILQKTPATFDVSVWEFFLPLLTGCTLVIAPPEAHRDPAWLARILREQRIDTCHFVPSMLAAFLATPGARGLTMKRVFCSGEELSAPLRDRFHATLTSELHNLYGPTEAAVDVSYWPADANDQSTPVPIGFPVWNTALYVLDERLRPLPPGVVGDLYLGGVQLARGYLGRSDLTAERFLPDPYRAGKRLYKTGDLARWREDGAVIFLGRSDHQVKLRGLRIELGDIEAAMASYQAVVRAEVLVREDRAGDKRLVAYVQPAANYDANQLRAHVAAKVPDYMVPNAFVELQHWPVTANGKLDRNALPAPTHTISAQRQPQTATEQTLAQIYADVLGLDSPPGAEADFFELGGDSLAAVDLMLRIQTQWQRNPGLGALFAAPSIEALAINIDSKEASFDSGLAPLIQLSSGDPARAPLFVIHPAGGIAWGYRHLAQALTKMSPDTAPSVFGLQSPALAPHEPLPPNIDQLAEQYVQRVLEVQPQGPIHLLGWSVGGIIAQAMAVALHRAGHQVGQVVMLDAYPSDAWRAEPEPTPAQALRALLAVAGINPDDHPHLTTQEEIVAFLRQSDAALGHLPQEALEGVVRVVTDTNRLIRQHQQQRFEGTLIHVRAGLDHANKPQLVAAMWQAYAQHLETWEIPMLHAHMTSPRASALIADKLLSLL